MMEVTKVYHLYGCVSLPMASLTVAFAPIANTTGPTVSYATSLVFSVAVASTNRVYVPAVRFWNTCPSTPLH